MEILTQKIIFDMQARKILGVFGALTKEELPEEYLALKGENCAFYLNTLYLSREIRLKEQKHYPDEGLFFLYRSDGTELLADRNYSEKNFQRALAYIKRAGNNLRRIK